MIDFTVDENACIRCGLCVQDCVLRALRMDDLPVMPDESRCIGCQHCLSICPTGAVSVLGRDPAASEAIAPLPAPEQVRALIRQRRSVRTFQEREVSPELLRELLDTAICAPTGANRRTVEFTVVETRAKMDALREVTYERLEQALALYDIEDARRLAYMNLAVKLWKQERGDVLFRTAPHLLVATCAPGAVTPREDCLIALTTFELYAAAHGVGTVWDGLATWLLEDIVPSLREVVGIPADHTLGYCMAFGMSAVEYARQVQRAPAPVRFAPL